MTYIPDARGYQQLVLGGSTGKYDCTAWMGAWLADAHTQGDIRLSGRSVRLASNEPVPDPDSPGLNLGQVDEAVRKLTARRVDLNTHTGIRTSAAQALVVEGCWMGLQVQRGVLVDAGFGGPSRFRDGHALTIHAQDGIPVIGDPLVPYYMRASWPLVWKAAGALVVGRNGETVRELLGSAAYATFTRDVVREYQVVVRPTPPAKLRLFNDYTVTGGVITHRSLRASGGFHAPCSEPRLYRWAGHPSRSLVRITGGFLKDHYVASGYAEELP